MFVNWQPTTKGAVQGVLAVQHSGKGGLVETELKGLFQPLETAAKDDTQKVSVGPASMDFGTSAGGIALVRSVVVSNRLPDPVKIQNISLNAPEKAGFSFKSQCPATLQPADMCSVLMTSQPTTKGAVQGVLAVQHSGKGGLVQTELKGLFQPLETAAKYDLKKVAAAPACTLSLPAALRISLVRSVVVSNRLPDPVKIQNISLNAPEKAGFSFK